MTDTDRGSPYAPHTTAETEAMLEEIGVDDIDSLFDIPADVRFDGEYGIDARDEATTRQLVEDILGRNRNVVELLGRGHYGYYVPSIVDHLADRSEFLTSYTQYQPEVSQGFLQALFEYQSIIVELTGLSIANCSMYDAASALGEAATLVTRVRSFSGERILVPDIIHPGKRATLGSYVSGTDVVLENYPTAEGTVDIERLESMIDESVAMVYVENPSIRGPIEPALERIGELTDAYDAGYVLGSDPVALSVLNRPVDVGVDIVIGDSSVLGLPTTFGMGLGLFATREEYLRQVPGRLVGISRDETDRRAYTLTLQTREQHIRRERATSNICTNQAWVALRAAMHASMLGPEGLIDLARQDIENVSELVESLNAIEGIEAPVDNRHHFREFVARTEEPADRLVEQVESRGFAIHAIGDHEIQCCVSGSSPSELTGFVDAIEEVIA